MNGRFRKFFQMHMAGTVLQVIAVWIAARMLPHSQFLGLIIAVGVVLDLIGAFCLRGRGSSPPDPLPWILVAQGLFLVVFGLNLLATPIWQFQFVIIVLLFVGYLSWQTWFLRSMGQRAFGPRSEREA